jgi:ribonuclease-3
LVKEKGPSHNKEFIVQVKVDNIVLGKGIAKTKKEAEQNAAKDALNKKAKL